MSPILNGHSRELATKIEVKTREKPSSELWPFNGGSPNSGSTIEAVFNPDQNQKMEGHLV